MECGNLPSRAVKTRQNEDLRQLTETPFLTTLIQSLNYIPPGLFQDPLLTASHRMIQ